MISFTSVFGPLPAATARIAMSRSVIMPTSESFVGDGQRTAIVLAHHEGGLTNRMGRTGEFHVRGHRVFDCIGFLRLFRASTRENAGTGDEFEGLSFRGAPISALTRVCDALWGASPESITTRRAIS